MRGLRLERPPRWGILTLLLLVLGNAAVFFALATRAPSAEAYSPVAAEAPGEPSAAPSAPSSAAPGEGNAAGTAQPPVLAVYGDGYAAGNQLGGVGAAGWPALVAARTGATLDLHAVSRAGYASKGVDGESYLDLVQANPPTGAAVTILFGTRNDAGENPAAVQKNAKDVITAVEARAPRTDLLVIGPVWSDAQPPASALAARDAVAAAAKAAGVTFVDPLKEGWFARPGGLIASDGISPTDQGNAYLADKIVPLVQPLLERGAGQPPRD